MDDVDQGVLVLGILKQAPDVGEQNQLFRLEGGGQLGGCGVGIDIVGGLGVHALGHGGDHRDVAVVNAVLHHLGVDLDDLTHQAVLGVLHLGLKEGGVHAAQAHGLAPHPVEGGHQVLVHPAAEHLLDNVHRLLVGVPETVHKLGLLADLFQHLVDLRAAAVDHYHVDAHQSEQDNVAHDGGAQVL